MNILAIAKSVCKLRSAGVVAFLFASSIPAFAQTTFSGALVNEATLSFGGGFQDQDPDNNKAWDIDFARGEITVRKLGEGGQTLDVTATPALNSGTAPFTSLGAGEDETQADTGAGTYDFSAATGLTFVDATTYTYDPLDDGTYLFTETMDAGAKLVAVDCQVTRPGDAAGSTLFSVDGGTTELPATYVDGGGAYHAWWSVLNADQTLGATALADGLNSVLVNLAPGEVADCTLENRVVDLTIEKLFQPDGCGVMTNAVSSGVHDSNADTAATNVNNPGSGSNPELGDPYTPGSYNPTAPATECYQVIIQNNGSSDTSSEFSFSDVFTLPTNMVVNGDITCAPSDVNSVCAGEAAGATHTFPTSVNSGGVVTLGLSGATTTIAGGEQLVISIPVDIPGSVNASLITNTATVSDPYDSNADDTPLSASVQLYQSIRADIGLAKEDRPALDDAEFTDGDFYVPGEASEYLINVCNFGPSDVTKSALGTTDAVITLNDNLPAGLDLAPLAGLSCTATLLSDVDAGGLSVPAGTLPSGVAMGDAIVTGADTSGVSCSAPVTVSNLNGTVTTDTSEISLEIELPAYTCATVSVPYIPYNE